MSVLENFFRISMVIMIVTAGMNLTISVFGQAMTGQNPLITINNDNVTTSAPSSIYQSGSTPTTLPFVNPSQNNTLANISLYFLGIQALIWAILYPLGLGALATGLNALLIILQVAGGAYIVASGIAILRGSGGAP